MQKLESNRSGNIILQPTGYQAFIPHKIFPNGPKIEIDPECIMLLSEADRALGELKGITETVPEPDIFIGFYVRKEALLSSQIEGTQCSLDEVIQVDEKSSTMQPVQEVVNYIKAMNYGLEKLQSLPMSLRLINEIHSKLLEGVRGQEKDPGEYKRYQNWVGPPGCRLSEAIYVPPPPNSMIEYMGDLENYYHEKDTLPPLIKASLLHSYFETIHPYIDGNGRLGRLLITFMLCEKKVLDKPLLYLSLFFKENKSHYYELLMNVRFKGQWEEWIKFFLRGVRNTSIEAIETANEMRKLHEKDKEVIKNHLAQYKLSFPIYDLLCKKPILGISEVAEKLDTNYPSVKHLFDKFISFGILEVYGKEKQRNKLFIYAKYLDILRHGT